MSILQSIRQILKPLSSGIRPGGFGTRFVQQVKQHNLIAGGLFSGMSYVGESICSTNISKYLGSYEIELKPVFEELLKISFNQIVDVGAAEGYYAVGCALRWKSARVVAYETTAEGRSLIDILATNNRVSDRVEIKGHFTPEELAQVTSQECQRLIIMDVEGAEEELLNPDKVHALTQSHIVVEIHDFVDPLMGDRIKQTFAPTHRVQEIWSRERRLSDFEAPTFLPLKWYVLPSLIAYASEWRPGPMRWLYLCPRSV